MKTTQDEKNGTMLFARQVGLSKTTLFYSIIFMEIYNDPAAIASKKAQISLSTSAFVSDETGV
jgi:hypothetical protein